MRIARFVAQSEPAYGIVEGEPDAPLEELTITELHGDPFFQGIHPTATRHALADVRLVAPIIPRSKVVGVGRNWAGHAAELGNEVPDRPQFFLKPNTSVVGPGEPVTLPSWSEEVSYEAELAVVIGTICKEVPVDRVDDVVFGYTVANDLTARDAQRADLQWARAKGFDGACPLGPWIETGLDTSATEDLRITMTLDGRTVQDGTTADMVFGVREIVAAVSEAFTLLPGDVILTGTPAGVGTVEAGQRTEATVEGIGTLASVYRR
ncbi:MULTISPECIES: fumarylacetoacetate hydrolase family protein [Micrococcaceae]|uniref:fumarylacetoacetate hydrolase family protein n=1 Tax=Micrococcaceae TaxID=1268 RepID=UPI001607290A|nr:MULTISPECIES: fumarylacetoacetate hydrolase family protein [Micrococcaceae]MBB5748425.1 2-keto-4-pentenoate hydratase/2-oxohepta-3-ene-1,7-dioic acid hydratase in catechol pathway [Micrococcus sp. TA1]HRO31510.1 fumarylacetoacetate hydrolase family protein [Citricoccus sp.]HRO95174.1 fumarylacetoacetate hydrolase family protein [Citricoccus sp.]